MTMYGANPEQLASLGRTLKQQINTIEGVMSTVSPPEPARRAADTPAGCRLARECPTVRDRWPTKPAARHRDARKACNVRRENASAMSCSTAW